MPLYKWQDRFRLMHIPCYFEWSKGSPIIPKSVAITFVAVLVVFLAFGVVLGFYAARPRVFLPLMPFLATILAGVPAALIWVVTWIADEIRFCLRNRQ